MSPVAAKNQFSVESPTVSRPPFEAAPQKSFENLGVKKWSRSSQCPGFPVGQK